MEIRRYSKNEVSDLKYGDDFRKPEYRRESFLRFYTFQLKYHIHSGQDYFSFPFFKEKLNLNAEQMLWFAFLNGSCLNNTTSWKLFERAPTLDDALTPEFETWFNENYKRLPWYDDRKWEKSKFIKHTHNYKKALEGNLQVDFFNKLANTSSKQTNYNKVWDKIINDFSGFGRFGTYSYMEFLKIVGLPIEASSLFLRDQHGSRAHRNGLCRVLGREDWVWEKHKANTVDWKDFTNETFDFLEWEADLLLDETRIRAKDIKEINEDEIGYFTLETAFCCYSKFFKSLRYPNVYIDNCYHEIVDMEKRWGQEFTLFREMRKKSLPEYLLLEYHTEDKGFYGEKKNLFMEKGQIPMMDLDWPCFKNDFNDRYYHKTLKIGLENFFD